jgi:arylsulfatase A-like enzyme
VLEQPPIGLPAKWKTVADVFSEQGYATAAFNAANPWLTSAFNYDSGFETFVDFMNDESASGMGSKLVDWMQQVQHLIPENGLLRDELGLAARTFCSFTNNFPIESADTVTSRATEWLTDRTGEKPFFLWIHYMDPHYPWTPDSDDVSKWDIAKIWHKVSHIYNSSSQRPDSETLSDVRQLYSSEVSNVDSAIGTLLDELNQLNLRDQTVICFTSDHGTELGDHGGFSHGPNSLYEEVVHVPLAVSGPGVPKEMITNPVQHIDIPATLVDVSELETSIPEIEYGWAGNSLLQSRRDEALLQVIYEYNPAVDTTAQSGTLNAIVDYPWKLHWNEDSNSTELYHLADDPNESDDMSDTHCEKVNNLKEKIRDEQDIVEIEHRTAAEITRVRNKIEDVKFL